MVSTRAVRRREQVGPDGLRPELGEVRVPVDQARHERASGEVHDRRRGALAGPLDVGARADGDDAAGLDGDGLGRRLRVVDGDDVAAGVDRIGCLRGIDHGCGRCGGRLRTAGDQQDGHAEQSQEQGNTQGHGERSR